MSEIVDMRAGKYIAAARIAKDPDDAHSVPCFGGGGLRGYVAEPSHTGERVLIGCQGALCGKVYRAKGSFYATEHAVVVTAKTGVDLRWAYHALVAMDLNQHASRSAQPGLAVGTLAALPVRVPSYRDQKKLGELLDLLDARTAALSLTLTAERAVRRVQYGHYRDMLLNFEELAA